MFAWAADTDEKQSGPATLVSVGDGGCLYLVPWGERT